MDTQIVPNRANSACVCAALRSAARATTQFYDLVLQPTGLNATQFTALQTIEQAGELPQWSLARQHAVAVETLSRRLAVLRRKGLVSVRTGQNHGERIYRLTEDGKLALARAVPFWKRAQERLRRTLGDHEVQGLLAMCENTVAATQQAEQLRTTNAAHPVPTGRKRFKPGLAGSPSGDDLSAVHRFDARQEPARAPLRTP